MRGNKVHVANGQLPPAIGAAALNSDLRSEGGHGIHQGLAQARVLTITRLHSGAPVGNPRDLSPHPGTRLVGLSLHQGLHGSHLRAQQSRDERREEGGEGGAQDTVKEVK